MTKQANRSGRPWQRKDGRWAARAYPPGDAAPKMVYAASEAEVLERQHALEAPGWPVLRVRSDESIGRPEDIGKLVRLKPPKPARITLNLPPELYRQLTRWADSAAETIDVPRVGVQDALRAMVRVITEGQAKNAEQQVYAAIRDELSGR